MSEIMEKVAVPSQDALLYQAMTLREELEGISDDEYPHDAQRIRDLFLSLTDGVVEQLELQAGSLAGDPDEDAEKIRSLSKVLHDLYSWLRYLRTSIPSQTPPAVQLAFTKLLRDHFPSEKNGDPIILVRPKWKYNFQCLPLIWHVRKIALPSIFDPDRDHANAPPDYVLDELWTKHVARSGSKQDRPRQIGILSFAGLDTRNTLLYPLLGHELGHFIDFSYDPPLYRSEPLSRSDLLVNKEVDRIWTARKNTPPDRHELQRVAFPFKEKTSTCLRELLADLIAARILGFGYFVALAEFLKRVAPWSQPHLIDDANPQGYPGIKLRLAVIHRHLVSAGFAGNIKLFLDQHRSHEQFGGDASVLARYLEEWEKELADVLTAPSPALAENFVDIPWRTVHALLADVEKVAEAQVPDAKCAKLRESFFDRINRLRQYLPPSRPDESSDSFSEIMSASWAYQLLHGAPRQAEQAVSRNRFEELAKTCRLVLKAIELIPHAKESQPADKAGSDPVAQPVERHADECKPLPGVLSSREIRRRINLPVAHDEHLAVVPFKPDSVQAASLDVRLGNHFALFRSTRLPRIRPGLESDERLIRTVGTERVYVPEDKTFLIHPGMFVLGTTLEFIALPGDVMGFVEGRSRLGRMGLIIATATPVAPGFHGVLVLEMTNTGAVALEVAPGMPIGQLVLQRISPPLSRAELYAGRYQCQIEP